MDVLYYFLAFVAFLVPLLCYGIYINGHFKRKGVKNLPSLPFFGNILPTLRQSKDAKDFVIEAYQAFPDRYMGIYQFMNPLIMINDLELIKQITIKDFDHFADKFAIVSDKIDPFFGSNLLSLRGSKWRNMRATLSPAFTSSKMRNMFKLVAECGEHIAEFYEKQMEIPENKSLGHVPVEMKDAFTRYTNDVIASTAFGIKVDSHEERENYFYIMAKESSNFGGMRMLKLIFSIVSPTLSKLFGLKMFDDELKNFFRTLVNDGIKSREDGKIYRPDMIQLLMEAKRGSLKHEQQDVDVKEAGFATVEESSVGKSSVKQEWTDDEITAQAILFLIAGFETASTLLSFAAHELAIHPDIQEKLREEIDEVALKNGGKIHYADLQNMKYMDMVVSETLRYWPPVISLDRQCSKPYTLPPPTDGGKPYQLKVGEGVWLPIMGIHHDPKFFPNPEKFDPERFSEENKGSIKPFSYMPFGVGPRNCIGSRFALMETKSVIFHLLHKFEFLVIPQTQVPIKLAKYTLNMTGERGFWIGLKPRNRYNSK